MKKPLLVYRFHVEHCLDSALKDGVLDLDAAEYMRDKLSSLDCQCQTCQRQAADEVVESELPF